MKFHILFFFFFFADDVLLFAKAYDTTIHTIKNVIHDFCQVSGMKINLEKSKLCLSPSIPPNRKAAIVSTLQIHHIASLGTYLGF